MRVLLLAPHADDETLFAAYSCLRENPYIVCCFNQDRAPEFTVATSALNCRATTIGLPGYKADFLELARHLGAAYANYDRVYAPKWEPDGHEDHNLVADVAKHVYGDRVVSYLTYAPRGERSRDGVEVPDVSAWEIAAKLRALSAYVSQIADPATRPWFTSLLDLREWTSGNPKEER